MTGIIVNWCSFKQHLTLFLHRDWRRNQQLKIIDDGQALFSARYTRCGLEFMTCVYSTPMSFDFHFQLKMASRHMRFIPSLSSPSPPFPPPPIHPPELSQNGYSLTAQNPTMGIPSARVLSERPTARIPTARSSLSLSGSVCLSVSVCLSLCLPVCLCVYLTPPPPLSLSQ